MLQLRFTLIGFFVLEYSLYWIQNYIISTVVKIEKNQLELYDD